MAKKFKIFNERFITDFLGNQICPGNVIAVSRGTSQDLQAFLVSCVREKSLGLVGFKFKRTKDEPVLKTITGHYGTYTHKEYKYEKVGTPTASFVHLDKNELQNHLVLIQNPLYSVVNPQMNEVISCADFMKDAGYFPKDYKFGNSLLEEIAPKE